MSIINQDGLNGRDNFLGFTFNGKHSSDFRIVRVINGDRDGLELFSSPIDSTIGITGRDGGLFVRSTKDSRTFLINFAFDDLREESIRQLQEWLSLDNEGDLIFDEYPYKAYRGKVTGSPVINFIAFEEDRVREVGTKGSLDDRLSGDYNVVEVPEKHCRVYKGEGSVQFTCYSPTAKSVHLTNEDFNDKNKQLWIQTSGILKYQKDSPTDTSLCFSDLNKISNADGANNGNIRIYNGGQKPTPMKFLLRLTKSTTATKDNIMSLKLVKNGVPTPYEAMYINLGMLKEHLTEDEEYFLIDTQLHLILGIDKIKGNDKKITYREKGKICNYALVAGDFFNIPKQELDDEWSIVIDGARPNASPYYHSGVCVWYDYLYY